jgi:hypothetical protein
MIITVAALSWHNHITAVALSWHNHCGSNAELA